MQRFSEAVRKRLTSLNILATIPVLAVVFYIDGGDADSMIIGLAGIALAGLFGIVIESYRIDGRHLKLLFGLVVCVGGLVGIEEGVWPVLACLVGTWTVLDAVYDYRHDIERRGRTKTDMDFGERQNLSRTAHTILAELREYAKTRDQLHAAVDEDDELDDALDRLERAGIVAERGGAYYVNETRLGPSGFLRKIGSRIVRPFTISA